MGGWVKLWRKLIVNGHLKMPDAAFKLWLYCLLEATPYPVPERELEPGELWLSYDSIRDNISEEGVRIGRSTVSNALKYLERNGYIKLEAIKFKGIKARVVNWSEYQSGGGRAASRPGGAGSPQGSPIPSQTALAQPAPPPAPGKSLHWESPLLTGPGLGVGSSPPAGPGHPDESSAGIRRVFPESSDRTRQALPESSARTRHALPESSARTRRVLSWDSTSPPAGLVRADQPRNGAAFSAPKNIENNLKNKDPSAIAAMAGNFEREFGRPLSPLEIAQLIDWKSSFADDLVKEALNRAVTQDKRSIAYVGGILRSWRRFGIETVEDARRELVSLKAKGVKRHARDRPGYRPSAVDWAAEPDTL